MVNLSIAALLITWVSLIYYIYSFWCTKQFFDQPNTAHTSSKQFTPPVSILKPLKSPFAGWEKNLESFCHQDYAEYEIVIGTTTPTDPSLDATLKGFSGCPVRLSVTDKNPGPNYKVGNLVAARSKARFNILAISDADMRVNPGYLKAITEPFQEKEVGLVTCLYRGVRCKTFPSKLEALVVQTDFIPGVLVANRLGPVQFAFGATIALKTDILKEIGGFEVLFPYLADDYQLGYRVSRKGYKIAIARHLVDHVVGKKTWIAFLRQQLRWAVTCRVCKPAGYFFSIISHGVSIATINLLINRYSTLSFLTWLLIISTRYATAIYSNSKFIQNNELKPVFWILPFKDICNSLFWAASFITNKIFWAGNVFKVKRDGTMKLFQPTKK